MDNAATQRWNPGDPPDASPSDEGDDVLIGCVVHDRYLISALLGRGATADVYRAHDQQLERDVAVKILIPSLCNQPDAMARFLDESLVAARVHHPNVASVFETGVHAGRPFIVMECVSGGTLADRIRQGRLPVEDVRRLAFQVLGALEASHERGVMHRDVKPSNILLTASGAAKLADFGIAKDDGRADLTAVGMVVGTPSYMAPERMRGSNATPQSDLYAVGVVLRDALAGEPADQPLSAAIARATHPDPDQRFTSAAAMSAAMRQQPVGRAVHSSRAGGSTNPASPARQVAMLIVAVLVVLAAGVVAVRTLTPSSSTSNTPTSTTLPLDEPLRGDIDGLREAVGS